jgi:hypothetical protein
LGHLAALLGNQVPERINQGGTLGKGSVESASLFGNEPEEGIVHRRSHGATALIDHKSQWRAGIRDAHRVWCADPKGINR